MAKKILNDEMMNYDTLVNIILTYFCKYNKLSDESRKVYRGTTKDDYEIWLDEQAFADKCDKLVSFYYQILKQPYFARMDFFNWVDEESVKRSKFYIGKQALIEDNVEYIIDWRSPVAKCYYTKNIKHFTYRDDERNLTLGFSENDFVHYYLLLKRTFNIPEIELSNEELHSFDWDRLKDKIKEKYIFFSFDDLYTADVSEAMDFIKKNYKQDFDLMEYTSFSDDETVDSTELVDTRDILRKELINKRNLEKVTDIIKTIQDNQYKIITKNIDESIILQGCAGSGKTMILLHRLSYLIYNVKDLYTSNVRIIVPNVSFSNYIDELATDLGIEKIMRTDIGNYYIEILRNYNYLLDKIPDRFIPEVKNSEFLKYIYSESMYNKIEKMYKEYIHFFLELIQFDKLVLLTNNPDVYSQAFHEKIGIDKNLMIFKKELMSLSNTIYNKKVINYKFIDSLQIKRDNDFQFDKFINSLKLYCDALISNYYNFKDRYELEMIALEEEYSKTIEWDLRNKRKDYESIKYLKQRIDNLGFLESIFTKKELERKLKEQQLVIDFNENKVKEYNKKRFDIQEAFNNISKSFDLDYKEEIKSIEKYIDISELKRNKKLLSSIINLIKDFNEKINNMLLINEAIQIIDSVSCKGFFKDEVNVYLSHLLEDYGLKETKDDNRKDYKWYYYVLLLTNYIYQGPLDSLRRYLFIDEGQDISAMEYKLLHNIHNEKTVFNIYGDVNQNIYEWGINNWDEIDFVSPECHYCINENYRNSYQINQFCNYYFSKNNLTLGPDGNDVLYCTEDEAFDIINAAFNNKNEKIAIVLSRKNFQIANKLRSLSISHNNYNELLSYYFIDEIKGLEFKNVLVFTEKMETNERYISFTRSLDKLLVCGNFEDKIKIEYVQNHVDDLFRKNEDQFIQLYNELKDDSEDSSGSQTTTKSTKENTDTIKEKITIERVIEEFEEYRVTERILGQDSDDIVPGVIVYDSKHNAYGLCIKRTKESIIIYLQFYGEVEFDLETEDLYIIADNHFFEYFID